MKRFIAIFMAIVFCVSMLSMTAFAEPAPEGGSPEGEAVAEQPAGESEGESAEGESAEGESAGESASSGGSASPMQDIILTDGAEEL